MMHRLVEGSAGHEGREADHQVHQEVAAWEQKSKIVGIHKPS